MNRALLSIWTICSLGVALVAGASLTGSPATAQAPAPAPAANTPAAPAAPPRTETVVYDNWTVTCRDTIVKDAKRTCSATLRVTNNQTRQNVLILEISNDAAGKPTFAIRTPLGVMIKEGVQIAVGNAKPRKVDFALCDTRGCEAAAPFDVGFSRDLSAANEASVTFMAMNGQPVTLKIPLKGIAQVVPARRS